MFTWYLYCKSLTLLISSICIPLPAEWWLCHHNTECYCQWVTLNCSSETDLIIHGNFSWQGWKVGAVGGKLENMHSWGLLPTWASSPGLNQDGKAGEGRFAWRAGWIVWFKLALFWCWGFFFLLLSPSFCLIILVPIWGDCFFACQ